MAKQRSEYELIIKATDAYSKEFDRLDRRVSESAKKQDGPDFARAMSGANLGGLARIGRTVGEIADFADSEKIAAEAAQARNQAYLKYRETQLQIHRTAVELEALERKGKTSDAARVAAALLRRDIEKDTAAIQRRASEEYRRDIAAAAQTEFSRRIVGAVGKAGAALMIAREVGVRLQDVGRRLDDAVGRFDETKTGNGLADAAILVGEMARAVPGVGELAEGINKADDAARNVLSRFAGIVGLSEDWVKSLESGEAALKRANAEAATVEKRALRARSQIAESQSIRGKLRDGTRVDRSPEEQIAFDRNAQLSELREQEQRLKQLGKFTQDMEKEIADRRASIEKDTADKLGAIEAERQANRYENAKATEERIKELRTQAAAATTEAIVADLRRSGKDYEADLVQVEQRYAEVMAEIERERQRIRDNPGGATVDAAALEQLRIQAEAAQRTRLGGVVDAKTEQARTVGDAMNDISRGVDDLRQPVNESRREQAQREYNKTLEDERKLLQQINELEKNAALTQEQRNQLAQQRADIQNAAEEKRQQIEASLTVATQGQRFFGGVDARFSQRSTAAAGDIEVFRQSLEKPGGEKGPMEEVAAGQKKQTEIMIKMQTAIDRLVANIGPPVTA
jgi:hypothetical protein